MMKIFLIFFMINLVSCGTASDEQESSKDSLLSLSVSDPAHFLGVWYSDINSVSYDKVKLEFYFDKNQDLNLRSAKRDKSTKKYGSYRYRNSQETASFLTKNVSRKDEQIVLNSTGAVFSRAGKKAQIIGLYCETETPNIAYWDSYDTKDVTTYQLPNPNSVKCKRLDSQKSWVKWLTIGLDIGVGGVGVLCPVTSPVVIYAILSGNTFIGASLYQGLEGEYNRHCVIKPEHIKELQLDAESQLRKSCEQIKIKGVRFKYTPAKNGEEASCGPAPTN